MAISLSVSRFFVKYLTFPEYDVGEDKLKLEWWLFHIMNGDKPIVVLWNEQERSVPL